MKPVVLDLHPRTLRRNIWSGLLCATDQEITDGMDFYPGAYGLCRLFASIYNVSVEQVAGIYAALSPMNTWDTNVANIVDVLRFTKDPSYVETHFTSGPFRGMTEEEAIRHDPVKFDKLVEEILAGPIRLKVNTNHLNRNKALSIARGTDPLVVLKGRKVRAFYSAIADPDDCQSIPVDRHLICLALGRKITSNQSLRAFASDRDLIAADQRPFFHPDSPICCDRAMWTMGANRFQCGQCKRTRARQSTRTPKRPLPATILTDFAIPRDILSIDSRGRLIIYLGVGHPYARSGGVNWLSRYIVESHLGHRLRTDEHVHHGNGILTDCRLSNLEVWLAERHGRHHARTQLLYMFRDEKGRFAPSKVPSYGEQLQDTYDFDLDSDLDPSLSASNPEPCPVPF